MSTWQQNAPHSHRSNAPRSPCPPPFPVDPNRKDSKSEPCTNLRNFSDSVELGGCPLKNHRPDQCPPAGPAIDVWSVVDRSGVSSFHRTDPIGRLSILRIRIGSVPI